MAGVGVVVAVATEVVAGIRGGWTVEVSSVSCCCGCTPLVKTGNREYCVPSKGKEGS